MSVIELSWTAKKNTAVIIPIPIRVIVTLAMLYFSLGLEVSGAKLAGDFYKSWPPQVLSTRYVNMRPQAQPPRVLCWGIRQINGNRRVN